MNHHIAFHIFPHTKKQWLGTVAAIFLIAAAAKLAISLIQLFFGLDGDPFPLWQGYLISLEYTSIILMMQLISGELAHQIFPLKNKTTAVIHIFIQSISAALSFVIARQIELIVIGDCVIPSGVFTAIISVSFVLSILGNSIYYLMLFYRRAKAAEQAALEAELKALRAQINPHFLFNTLNSIAALIRTRPDEAEAVTEALADLFRYSLRASKQPLVTLEDELESVKLYLSIEKARFRERLHTSIDVPPHLLNASVPSLLLQPLVENAIKHGANKVEGDFFMHLSATEKDNRIEFIVHDSGNGFDLSLGEAMFKKGTGLQNVRERLSLLFPRNSELIIEKHAVVLHFPIERTLVRPLLPSVVSQ
ncbi:MAG: sensor histidine kinase [Chloroherpetonaceae bacterium]